MFTLKEKVALVTGGCGGIGLAIVKEFLRNGLKKVAIVDIVEDTARNVLEDIESTFGPNRAVFIRTDVTDKAQLEEAFQATVRAFDQLDIVVNNAGIMNEVDWEKTVAVNLTAVIRGSYLAMEKYLPGYKSGEEGVIVNTASIVGLLTMPSIPTYNATKLGVVGLGKALGGEEYLKRYGVRVLTICPGLVDTPMVSLLSPEKIVLFDKAKEEIAKGCELPQSPECVAMAVMKALNEGRSGSLWVTENRRTAYEIEIPARQSMCKK